MATSTLRQRKQQCLSWKLRMVMGARANLYPRECDLPEHIRTKLHRITGELQIIEQELLTSIRNIP